MMQGGDIVKVEDLLLLLPPHLLLLLKLSMKKVQYRSHLSECNSRLRATGDGSGGNSIYGGKFNDEKAGLKLKHERLGAVGMANSGKNSNTSQFYITLEDRLPRLDGKHVVFGQVVEGLDILKRIGTATPDLLPPFTLST